MKIIALLPIKTDSKRLTLKNFRMLDVNTPLWKYTYDILAFRNDIINKIYITTDELAFDSLRSFVPENQIYIEGVHYHRGKTLGQTIANFINRFVKESEETQYFQGDEYLLVPQVDLFPKYSEDIDKLVAFAIANPTTDYIITGKAGVQNGSYRLIKMPLNQETLGQTIGMVELGGDRVDIHYQEEFNYAKKIYEESRGGH